MSLPRALCGPVRAMARPSRPPAEIAAVKAAAAIVRAETGLRAAEPVARVIAERVVAALIADLERNADDYLAEALAAVEQRLFASPFVTLATCPEIDTVHDLIKRQTAMMQNRNGRYLSKKEQTVEVIHLRRQLLDLLASRYTRHSRLN